MPNRDTKSVWLLSSGGRRGALVGILQNDVLGGSEVVVTDAQYMSAAGHLANRFELVPRITDEEFIPKLLKIVESGGVDFILPTLDPELSRFAEFQNSFRSIGAEVFVSRPDVIALSEDKWEFSQWLQRHGFPSVRTVEIGSSASLNLRGAVIAKPRTGSSGIGIATFQDVAELSAGDFDDSYIVQELATGIEFTVDFAVTQSGKFLGAVPRRRLEVRAGEVSKGVTVHSPLIEELTREIARSLEGAYGILNIQLFFNPESRDISVIEMNARVGGGYPLTHQAGADFLSALAGGGSREMCARGWQSGLLMLRYDEATFVSTTEYEEVVHP